METVSEISVIEAAFGILFRGGWVLAPIFVLGWFGWFLMIERYCYYFRLNQAAPRALPRGTMVTFTSGLAHRSSQLTEAWPLSW